MPGFSVTVSVLLSPLKVGVAPTTACDEDSSVTLCSSGDMFVKSIATLPALAVSLLVLYCSLPSGFAERGIAPGSTVGLALIVLEPAGAPGLVVVVVELVGAVALLFAVAVELVEGVPLVVVAAVEAVGGEVAE